MNLDCLACYCCCMCIISGVFCWQRWNFSQLSTFSIICKFSMISWLIKNEKAIDIEYLACCCYLLYVLSYPAFDFCLACLAFLTYGCCLLYGFDIFVFFINSSSTELHKSNGSLVKKYIDFKMSSLTSLGTASVLQSLFPKPLVFGIAYINKSNVTYNYAIQYGCKIKSSRIGILHGNRLRKLAIKWSKNVAQLI